MDAQQIEKIEKYIGIAEDVCGVVKSEIGSVLSKSDKKMLMVFAGLSLAASVLTVITNGLNQGGSNDERK